jgi:hypothetical protein
MIITTHTPNGKITKFYNEAATDRIQMFMDAHDCSWEEAEEMNEGFEQEQQDRQEYFNNLI